MCFFDETIKKEILYLMMFLEYYIEKNVYEVLNDSDIDPEYSAVSTTNLIKCFRDISILLGEECNYSDLRGYFAEKMLTEEEFCVFEEKRIQEEAYYVGKRYYQDGGHF